jgi:hypothetical protein
MLLLEKYSFGTGDRFGMQGIAQLKALRLSEEAGYPVVPVWNKSNREHQIIGSKPEDTRTEADRAIRELSWKNSYYVDADHINMKNVDQFIDHCNYFTIDVAEFIGKQAEQQDIEQFINENRKYTGELQIPGIKESFLVSQVELRHIGSKFLLAVREAGRIFRHIASRKGESNFVAEVSMDEVDEAQSPVELFFILSMLAAEKVMLQTIAPKFTGRFNKGIDYIGNLSHFSREFEQDLLLIEIAVKEFGLPSNLKLSIHSGSDKFSIYPVMGSLIRKFDKGLHIKTAGTTWLEEVIGLALAGGPALELAKSIYRKAYERREELSQPYATVIDIQPRKLPLPIEVKDWSSRKFASALRHVPDHPDFNPSFRQLLHVGYKIAAEYGVTYKEMVRMHAAIISDQVCENIFERHLKRLFMIKQEQTRSAG